MATTKGAQAASSEQRMLTLTSLRYIWRVVDPRKVLQMKSQPKLPGGREVFARARSMAIRGSEEANPLSPSIDHATEARMCRIKSALSAEAGIAELRGGCP